MSRIWTIVLKDLAYSRKENILLYIILFPLILATLMSFILPFMEQMDMTFAVDESVPAHVVEELHQFARVEIYAGRDQLQERVMRFDDVPGIYYQEGRYFVLLEGNESEAMQDLPGAIIDYLNNDRQLIEISRESLGKRSLVRQFVTIVLIMMCGTIGGLAIGLSIVNERENRIMRAYAVTPVSTGQYIIGKSITVMIISVVLAVLVAAIAMAGHHVDYPRILTATLAALGVYILIGLVMGVVANNQITAIAVMKVMFVAVQWVPIAGLLLPARYMWVLYPFPNYWAFESLRRIFLSPEMSTLSSNLIALVSGLALLGALTPVIKSKFRLG